mmetsp:Transcript_14560/g.27797  ORF Transcript_14560/g.27797 Transcript_14560/m.27797 type:complete len:209 (+) Transcript_14560:408-1034(+)
MRSERPCRRVGEIRRSGWRTASAAIWYVRSGWGPTTRYRAVPGRVRAGCRPAWRPLPRRPTGRRRGPLLGRRPGPPPGRRLDPRPARRRGPLRDPLPVRPSLRPPSRPSFPARPAPPVLPAPQCRPARPLPHLGRLPVRPGRPSVRPPVPRLLGPHQALPPLLPRRTNTSTVPSRTNLPDTSPTTCSIHTTVPPRGVPYGPRATPPTD